MKLRSVVLALSTSLPLVSTSVRAHDHIDPPQQIREEQGDFYPPASMRMGEEGDTAVLVAVNTDGRVADCKVTKSSGYPELDEKSCDIARRYWIFKPATQAGRPVFSTLTKTVKWRINNITSH